MTVPAETPAPVPVPDTTASAGDEELRALVAEIVKQTSLGFEPTQIVKAIITAVDFAAAPPTVSLTIAGDTETTITEVRSLNNYTPIVGNTVLLAKQGSDIVIIGQIAGTNPLGVGFSGDGWTQATLTNGTHGGNSNGDIYYRRVLDHGTWKMQWRGGWSPGGATTMIAGGGLGTDFRPSSKRSCLAARQINGSTSVQFDFGTDGSVELIGQNVANLNTDTTNNYDTVNTATGILTSYQDPAGATPNHQHTLYGHAHSVSGHTHFSQVYVDPPSWVSLNGIEYFL